MVKKNREKSVLKHGEYTHIHVSIDFLFMVQSNKMSMCKDSSKLQQMSTFKENYATGILLVERFYAQCILNIFPLKNGINTVLFSLLSCFHCILIR